MQSVKDSPFRPEATENIRGVMRPDETLLWSAMPRQRAHGLIY
jgi:hypothetical protein